MWTQISGVINLLISVLHVFWHPIVETVIVFKSVILSRSWVVEPARLQWAVHDQLHLSGLCWIPPEALYSVGPASSGSSETTVMAQDFCTVMYLYEVNNGRHFIQQDMDWKMCLKVMKTSACWAGLDFCWKVVSEGWRCTNFTSFSLMDFWTCDKFENVWMWRSRTLSKGL